MPKDNEKLTNEWSLKDFQRAFSAKRKLIDRQQEDFLFSFGKQWEDKDVEILRKAGVKAVTDNRIQPNIFLLTGLERQNRTDFRAFPEGEEDSIKSEIASVLFKHSIKISEFSYKSSDQFKDGVTCGESHLELYLDNTFNLLNGKPVWKKTDGNSIFPEPGFREYDFADARYVYKLTRDLSKEDLMGLFPEQRKMIEEISDGTIDFKSFPSDNEIHQQHRDYPATAGTNRDKNKKDGNIDLLERYYKKWVEKTFVGDRQTGEIKESESKEKADNFVDQFDSENPDQANRFKIFKRVIPEIWYYAHVPGSKDPLADEVAWFYPKWKSYPFIPYFARFSTAPITGDDRHLLVQGVVHGVKNAQERHNKSETLLLRHLNTAANSGWIAEEDSWVDLKKVEGFGSTPGINLEYKQGKPKPERIFPMPLSQGHAQLAEGSAEAIKAQAGDQCGFIGNSRGWDKFGKAIALRQRQGLLMIQELFDNLARTRVIAGRFILSQLSKIYDTETAKKVLGSAFLEKNFPPIMMQGVDENGQPFEEPETDEKGQPQTFDKKMAELEIATVLTGDLGTYDIAVGEAVASETMRMANASELKDIAQTFPGIIPPDLLIEESQLPQSTKNRVLSVIKQSQEAQQQQQIVPNGA